MESSYQELLWHVLTKRLAFTGVIVLLTIALVILLRKKLSRDSLPICIAWLLIVIVSVSTSIKAFIAYINPSVVTKKDLVCEYVSRTWEDEITFSDLSGNEYKLKRSSKSYANKNNRILSEGNAYTVTYEDLTKQILDIQKQ